MLREEDIIIMLYCAISDTLSEGDYKHPQSNLWLSEILLCGVLHALKGGSFRQFYTWLWRRDLAKLPERTRLGRLLKTHSGHCQSFLGKSGLFGVMDTFGIEIIRPIREGRSAQSAAITWKGKSGHRWIVGRKVAIRINGAAEITDYDDDTANVCDRRFNTMAANEGSITLADAGFKDKRGIPPTLKICKRGEWNDRMTVETLFSLWDRICHAKRIFVRSVNGFKTRIDYLVALTNLVAKLNTMLGFPTCSMVQYAL
jgi:hypothetical protein